jgi:hypothetical protein
LAIYEYGYRPYLGRREAPSLRPFVIATHAARAAWTRRGVKALLILGLLAMAVSAAFIYWGWYLAGLAQSFSAGAIENPKAAGFKALAQSSTAMAFPIIYKGHLTAQGFLVFILAMSVLNGLIAGDRRAGAVPLYVTRGTTRPQYLAGKLLAGTGLSALLLVVPSLALGALDFGFALPDKGAEVLWRVLGALGVGLAWSLLVGAMAVAASTLTPRPRLAAAYLAGVGFGLQIAVSILASLSGEQVEDSPYIALSPLSLAGQLTGWLMPDIQSTDATLFSGPVALALLIAWIFALWAFSYWRVISLGKARE